MTELRSDATDASHFTPRHVPALPSTNAPQSLYRARGESQRGSRPELWRRDRMIGRREAPNYFRRARRYSMIPGRIDSNTIATIT